MIDIRIFIPILASFFVTLFVLPIWIRKAKGLGLVWEDVHKRKSEKVAGSGGIVVALGFILGVLLFVAYRVFLLSATNSFLIEVFAALCVILIVTGIAFMDDLFGWRKGGMRKRTRLILVAFASIPIIAINAGKSLVFIPFIGVTDLGILYPLILVPIVIIATSTTFNFLEGFNGLGAGNGILILSALAIVSFFTGTAWLAIIALCMVAALLAFLIYNANPAKIFAGDTLTYMIGALIGIMAILGNYEKIAVFFFIPYILETILKLRGKLIIPSFGKTNKNDNTLELRQKKLCSLNHIAIYLLNKTKYKATENRVVFSIWLFQFIIIVIGFLIFGSTIFR